MITDNILPKENPVLLDKAIQELNNSLTNNLPWLYNAFGRAHKLIKLVENREFNYPGLYIGQGEYRSLLPDEKLNNYCFLETRDPQSVITKSISKVETDINIALVFWYNQSTIFGNLDYIYTEDIKHEILEILLKPGIIKSGRLTLDSIYEDPTNIFSGYSLKQIDNQYLMYPYAGLRIEGTFKLIQPCTIY